MSQLGWRGGKIVDLCPKFLRLKVPTPTTAYFSSLIFLYFMFVNDDIYYFLSDMTENEKRKEGDYLMTCFVIHVSLLSYTFFFRNSCLTKKLVVYHPLTNLSLTSVGFY